MPSYKMSSGQRVSKSYIDTKVRRVKKEKLKEQLDEFSYNFCEDCGVSSGIYLDCSHDISVDKCQKNGTSELAWDIDNITIRCRNCHNKHDKS